MKFYTAFLFDRFSAKVHCTHKYLGTLSTVQLCQAVNLIQFFDPERKPAPVCLFDEESTFQDKGDVYNVLIPSKSNGFEIWGVLRFALNEFRTDDFEEYRPHVSTLDKILVGGPFRYYGICYAEFVLFAWRLP